MGRGLSVLHVYLEEMQWKRTRPVSSAEFFHGALELLEKDVPLILVKGEGNAARWMNALSVLPVKLPITRW